MNTSLKRQVPPRVHAPPRRWAGGWAALWVIAAFATTAAVADSDGPHWLWEKADRKSGQHLQLQHSFMVSSTVTGAQLYAVGDAARTNVQLNGSHVAALEGFGPAATANIATQVKRGRNQLIVNATALADHAAVCVQLRITLGDGTELTVLSDPSWRVVKERDEPGSTAVSLGVASPHRWGWRGRDASISPLDDYTQWKQAINATADADAAAFQTAKGFQIELVRSANADEGSWVSLAFDPAGRAIIAREDKGLLRVTLPKHNDGDLQVETINDSLKECRGLTFVGRDLFVSANNDRALFRLRDSEPDDGVDAYDDVSKLLDSPGGVGHGRNDLAVGHDGRVYAIRGDSVQLPRGFTELPSPLRNVGIPPATEGHVIAFDPHSDMADATWRLFCAGLRNPYGIAFNADGEAFTYDADAEYDMGSSWYRPTRVRHLVSGADYGWRAVTRRWPPYFPDHPGNPPSNLDVGKGSPTGVMFGTKSNFPPPYHDALYILDWAYGRVLAVHMTPRGASYIGRAETFVKGQPLNVTDLDFGPDGAMYVVTGGRRTKSALYRVRYVGPPARPLARTKQEMARAKHAEAARATRRRLEAFHGRQDESTHEIAWPYLDSPDPWLRQAARIAIEHQPVDRWRDRAMNEDRPTAKVLALTMLARAEKDERLSTGVIARLNRVNFASATTTRKQFALHAYWLCLQRTQDKQMAVWRNMGQRFDSLYPDSDFAVNRDLCLLLADLGSTRFVPKTIALLNASDNQHEQMHYLFALRNVKQGWTYALRGDYFRWLARMHAYRGGQGLPTFIKKIRDEALTALPDNERERWAAMLAPPKDGASPNAAPMRTKLVKQWRVTELASDLGRVGDGRSFEHGREMFAVAQCVRCHRVGSEGGVTGPDLTSLGARFSRRDVLEAIVEPSKVIAVNYRSVRIGLKDGQSLIGQIVMGGDYRSPELEMTTNALEPGAVTKVTKSDIVSHEALPLSPMPTGLINTLTRDEVLDLLAYLEAGGDQKHPVYSGEAKARPEGDR